MQDRMVLEGRPQKSEAIPWVYLVQQKTNGFRFFTIIQSLLVQSILHTQIINGRRHNQYMKQILTYELLAKHLVNTCIPNKDKKIRCLHKL
jgi:hypothetical protein